jgi:hypothetical protein
VHEDILTDPIRGDEAKSLHGVVPLDRAGLLDGGLVGRRIDGSLGRARRGNSCCAVLLSGVLVAVVTWKDMVSEPDPGMAGITTAITANSAEPSG